MPGRAPFGDNRSTCTRPDLILWPAARSGQPCAPPPPRTSAPPDGSADIRGCCRDRRAGYSRGPVGCSGSGYTHAIALAALRESHQTSRSSYGRCNTPAQQERDDSENARRADGPRHRSAGSCRRVPSRGMTNKIWSLWNVQCDMRCPCPGRLLAEETEERREYFSRQRAGNGRT